MCEADLAHPSQEHHMHRVMTLAFITGGMLACACLTACAPARHTGAPADPAPSSHYAASTDAMVATTLYFGLSSSDGSGVSEQEWQDFLDQFVTPRFPDGLTVTDAAGQYQMNQGGTIIRERSKVVTLIHDADAASRVRIAEIKAEYCRRFSQESVLSVEWPLRVEF
jgi:hypothetical protein